MSLASLRHPCLPYRLLKLRSNSTQHRHFKTSSDLGILLCCPPLRCKRRYDVARRRTALPYFANESDKTTARVIEHWKLTAPDEVDNIGAWRDADPSDRIHIYWPQCSAVRGTVHNETMPGMFFADTTHLVGRIENDYRHLDPAPLMELYEAIAAWHADKTAERIPPQPVLFSTMERAMIIVQVVATDLQSRLVATCDETEATDRASGRNTSAGAVVPLAVDTRPRQQEHWSEILLLKEIAPKVGLTLSARRRTVEPRLKELGSVLERVKGGYRVRLDTMDPTYRAKFHSSAD